MELKRSRIVSSVFLVLAIMVVFGITYAAFSQELNINGSATVKSSKWQIKFERDAIDRTNTSIKTSLSETAKEIVAPSIVGDTTIGDYSVSLMAPGDYVSYTFDVVNNGDYNAKISGVDIRTPMCQGSGDNATNDAANVCGKLKYTLKYSGTDNNVQVNDTLRAYERKTMVLTLSYDTFTDVNLLPKSDVSVSNLGITITYAQDGNIVLDSH